MVTQSPPQPVPSQAASQPQPAAIPGSASDDRTGATSLIPSNNPRTNEAATGAEIKANAESEFLRLSAPIERLPVGVLVSVPVRDFRVRNLLAMAPEELIETQWGHGEDLPLSS